MATTNKNFKEVKVQKENPKSIPFDSVRILGKEFRISEATIVPEVSANNCGHCDMVGQNITVVVGSGQQQIKDTMLHECIHALEYSVQLELEEKQVHALASLILQLLWDNPQLALWLIDESDSQPEF